MLSIHGDVFGATHGAKITNNLNKPHAVRVCCRTAHTNTHGLCVCVCAEMFLFDIICLVVRFGVCVYVLCGLPSGSVFDLMRSGFGNGATKLWPAENAMLCIYHTLRRWRVFEDCVFVHNSFDKQRLREFAINRCVQW